MDDSRSLYRWLWQLAGKITEKGNRLMYWSASQRIWMEVL